MSTIREWAKDTIIIVAIGLGYMALIAIVAFALVVACRDYYCVMN